MRRHPGAIVEIVFAIWAIALLVFALTRWDEYAGTTKALFISLAFGGSVSGAAAIRHIAGRHR